MIAIPSFVLRFGMLLGGVAFLSSSVSKSSSPIRWINKSFTVNVDTTSQTTNYVFSRYGNPNNYVYFEFENTGGHVTFLDGSTTNSIFKNRDYLTKPGERNTVAIAKSDLPYYSKALPKKDTVNKLLIPFYYEGETFMEEVEVRITFGKSKLIAYDPLVVDLTDSITKLVAQQKALGKTLSLRFKQTVTIQNISNSTILCSESFVAWNDAQYLNDNGKMIPIQPGESYELPVELNMDQKYRFKCNGYLQIQSKTVSEQHYFEWVSKYVY